MTPRERGLAALQGQQPDDIVPTFELEFQLTQEAFGTDFRDLNGLSGLERERAVAHNGELYLQIGERFDYSILRVYGLEVFRWLDREGAKKRFLLCGEADGTMAIPDGGSMEDLALELVEEPERKHEELARMASDAIEWGRQQIEAGADVLTMCADYCFNTNPFLSPTMFAEFVTPYLAQVIEGHHRNGALVIKHTDGNIMPILDQLVSARPEAIHSLDPQGGVDIAEVKRLVGDRVALCGNTNCALMQTGTDDEVIESARYALRHGMPGGGFIFCTSNVAFKGMALERYELMLKVRAQEGRYDA